MKTIGHILPFPGVGGTEHATVRIATAMDGSRLRSVAFYPAGADTVKQFLERHGITAVPYDPPVPSYRHAFPFLQSSWRLTGQLKQQKVDLVHCADLLAAHYGALAGKLAGLPVICHVRARFDVISRRDCSFLWPVDSFVFVSRNTREHFGCAKCRTRGTVVYDGIVPEPDLAALQHPLSVRQEFAIPVTAPLIGMVARIAPAKDYFTLANAARRILEKRPDARFLVVGDHTSDASREHYALVVDALRRNGVEGAFVFTGHREDVSRILAGIDVFVLSTHGEGLPLVILEAMAQGRPVVATAVGGIPEIVTSGETGLLFAHEDDAELANHVLRMLGDEAFATRLAAEASRLVATRFTRQRFAEEMSAVYSRALGQAVPQKAARKT